MSELRFGEILRRHRLSAGLSQEDLAARAGVSIETIGALERGVRRAPYRATVALLSEGLSLSAQASRELEDAARRNRARRPSGPAATSLIGRDADIAQVTALIGKHRLVSVIGSGGIGKTRLALEVGARAALDAARSVTFIDLTPVLEERLVPGRISALLELSRQDDSLAGIARALASSRDVLILDNCEHVLDAVAQFADAVCRTCPDISILATSRERLGVSGERVYRLPSLAYPGDGELDAFPSRSYASIELFLDRAKEAGASIDSGKTTRRVVADICRRLAGVPLAIELAAARTPMIGLEEIRERLNDRFVLTDSSASLPDRQRTMHATIAWSYNLLSEDEKTVFRRLGVFADSFRLEAAEFVCADERIEAGLVVDVLLRLVTKSLVNVVRNGERVRYVLLESVRAFALEELGRRNEATRVLRRHLDWTVTFSERFASASDTDWIEEALPELGNVRALLRWAFDTGAREDAIDAARVVGNMYRIWIMHTFNAHAEYRRWAELALERLDEAEHGEIVERLMPGLVIAARGAEVLDAIDRALYHAERLGLARRIAWLYTQKATELHRRGRFDEALTACEHAVAFVRESRDANAAVYAVALLWSAQLMAISGRLTEARERLAESLRIVQAKDIEAARFPCVIIRSQIEFFDGNPDLAAAIIADGIQTELQKQVRSLNLAEARTIAACYALALEKPDVAREEAVAALQMLRDPAKLLTWYVAVELIAAASAILEKPVPAARLIGFVDAWYENEGFRRDRLSRFSYDLLMTSLREQLSPDDLARHLVSGSLLGIEAVEREALSVSDNSVPA